MAERYAMNEEAIANRVYANRMGNGAERSGDGYKFRGRGYLYGIKGRRDYAALQTFIEYDNSHNLLLEPDLVSQRYPLLSAGFFFTEKKLWDICDKGATHEVVIDLTRKIDPTLSGLDDRLAWFDKFNTLLS